MKQYYATDQLEKRLKQKQFEWQNKPTERDRIEAEMSVLEIGIRSIKARNKFVPEEGNLSEDVQEALL